MVSCSAATCCAIRRLRFFCGRYAVKLRCDRKTVDRAIHAEAGLPMNYSAICGAGAAEVLSVKMRTKEISVAAETAMMTELLGKSKEELREFCAALGEPAFRGTQIYHGLYSGRKYDVAQITNLPAGAGERLSKEGHVTLPEGRQRFASADGSVRYLFGLEDAKQDKGFNTEGGEGAENAEKNRRERASRLQKPTSVEAVFMPSEGRQTICVSTQAGCAVDCHFCLTAQLGLIRNLTAGEILAQVLLPLEEAHQGAQSEKKDAGLKPAATKPGLAPQTNIVLMGQGEPLLNFEPVMAAMRIILDPPA